MNANFAQYKELFVKTSNKYIQDLQDNIVLLEQQKANSDAVDAMHIAAHSLGSQCLVMGFSATGQCSRSIEHVLYGYKQQQQLPHGAIVALLKQAIEKIALSLQSIETNGKELAITQETQQLEASGGRPT